MQFNNCEVRRGDQVYYEPDWGLFDLALGSKVLSVFGGPADRIQYGDLDTFESAKVPWHPLTEEKKKQDVFYCKIRALRETREESSIHLEDLIQEYQTQFPHMWLAGVELLELTYLFKKSKEKAVFRKTFAVFS